MHGDVHGRSGCKSERVLSSRPAPIAIASGNFSDAAPRAQQKLVPGWESSAARHENMSESLLGRASAAPCLLSGVSVMCYAIRDASFRSFQADLIRAIR
jgi:hypothetical protein